MSCAFVRAFQAGNCYPKAQIAEMRFESGLAAVSFGGF